MRKIGIIALGLGLLGIGVATGRYVFPDISSSENRIRGELVSDYVYDTPIGKFYRIELNTPYGRLSYPVLCDDEELIFLPDNYTSREDNSAGGDILSIDPDTNVFSLDESILLPKNIKRVEKAPKVNQI